MKRLWIAAALLAAVVAVCALTQVYQHRRMGALLATLDRMEMAYAAGDTGEAYALAVELGEAYEAASHVMLCYIAHSDMAESLETVALLPRLIEAGGGEELAMEIARLREEWRHLYQVDDPLLWQVL